VAVLKLKVNPARCLRRWYKDSTCTLCADSCPVKAVEVKGRDVMVNSSVCVLCGACSSVCPVGVFSLGVEELILSMEPGDTIRISCRDSGENVLSTCINALNQNHYLILASKFNKVVVDARCEGCPLAKGPGLAILEGIAGKLASKMEVVRGSGSPSPLLRRLTLKRMMVEGATLISPPLGAIASLVYEPVEVEDSRTPERARITFRLKALEVARALNVTVKLLHPAVDTSKCTFCGICAGVCPTGAIEFEEAGILRIDTSKCVGCSHCVKLCPDNAMTQVESEEPGVFEYTRSMTVCPRCGYIYPASLSECPKCSVILEILKDIYKGNPGDCREYGERIREKLRSQR
jgi:ferredoxin